MQIELIKPEETYIVRHPVLRKGRPIESCYLEHDFRESTFHLGLYVDEQLIGVCSLLKTSNNLFEEKKQYQLRGMAVLQNFQGKGYGYNLIRYSEKFLKNKNNTLLWCNARETASTFYKKNGYTKTAKPFNIESIGLHYIMYKRL